MSKGSSSCFKICFGCCVGIILFLIIMAGISAFYVKSNQMDPPVFEEISRAQEFDSHELQGVVLSELPPDVIPIKVTIDVNFCNLSILPNAPSGAIKVSGEYDKANGVFEFNTAEPGVQQEFLISYKNDKNILFNLGDGGADAALKRNHIMVHLPVDSAIDLQVIHGQGDLEIDLTGVPLNDLNIKSKMSEVQIRNMMKNPIVLNEFVLDHSMGELVLKNMENFRFNNLIADFSMGEYKLRSNGLFYRSAVIHVDASLGNFIFRFPENVKITNHLRSNSGSIFFTDQDTGEKTVDVELKGEVKWGEATIAQ